MTRIIASRGTGKTRALMEAAYKNNGIFICQNVAAMRKKAVSYGLSNLKIMSYYDFIKNIQDYPMSYNPNITIRGYKDPDDTPLYFDEVECLLNYLCLNTCDGYTLSVE